MDLFHIQQACLFLPRRNGQLSMCRPFKARQNHLALMFQRSAQIRAEAHYRSMPLL